MQELVDNVHQWINEIQLLAVAILVGFLQLCWAAIAARQQQGLAWARGARDEHKPITGVAARLERAFRNYMETFPLFAAAVIAAMTVEKTGMLTWWGSLLYVGARILYVPLYAAGVPSIRTLVWFISIVGLLMVVVALFIPNGAS
ncbi:MAG TPA: MAPEG family protein [Caulobacteraceae bacterium]|jgi:uncharacterized MAPEG superfamily protein|nr:MAPEG family protein [Caulobacteraceae bacterium]